MRYIPNSAEERETMLREMGRKSVADLFSEFRPAQAQTSTHLPQALSETGTLDFFRNLPSATPRDIPAKG